MAATVTTVLIASVVIASPTLSGCSGSDATSDSDGSALAGPGDASADRVPAGIVRTPSPIVDGTTVPSLSNPGEDIEFRAEPGGLLGVYFGYTNCPDVCPTTLADWAVALRRLPTDLAARVGTVMVTVDPDRDNDILADYVRSFVPSAIAAGTADADRLAAAAAPFGVLYSVTTDVEGQVEVTHSGFLYLVDDQGRLVLTWPFGLSSKDIADDMLQLFAVGAAGR